MALYVYNLTGSPVALAAGSPIVTVPASAAPPARGRAYNVTAELRPNLTVDPVNGKTGGLAASAYLLLQAQVTDGQLVFEWTADPEYLTPGLTVSTPGDEDPNLVKQTIAEMHVYADGILGNDANDGLQKSAGLGGSFVATTPVLATGLGAGAGALTASLGVITLTSAGTPGFSSALIGQVVVITGATTGAHNGTFVITSVPSTTQLRWVNTNTGPLPASEAYTGTWTTISATVTFTGTGAAWTTSDIGRVLTINYATSPDNAGSFLITGVPAANQVTYNNAFGVTESLPTTPVAGHWRVSTPKKNIQTAANVIPDEVRHNVCLHVSNLCIPTNSTGVSTIDKRMIADNLPNLVVDGGTGTVPISMLSGTGDTLAVTGTTVTLTDAGANFTSALIGKIINIGAPTTMGNQSATPPTFGHHGNFIITGVPSSTQLTWTNAAAGLPASEAYTGTWTIYPFDETRAGTGDNFTFTAGPNTVVLTDAGAAFTSADLGKSITIANSTTPGNDGTFVITAVIDRNNVTYVNAGGATEAFTGTWTLGAFTADIVSSGSIGLTTAGWGIDQWAGCLVEVVAAPSAPTTVGQTRLVVANTATTITPVRNFTTSPGANAKFRFVRPKTVMSSQNLTMSSAGGATSGSISAFMGVQNLYFDWSFGALQINASNAYVNLSHIMIHSRSSIVLNSYGSCVPFLTGNRYNPHTFAVEGASGLTSCAGVSAFNRLIPGGSTYSGALLRGMVACQVNSCFFPLLMFVAPQTDLYLARQGTRALHCAIIQCHGGGMANLFSSTSGYATTRFGNHPSKAAIPGIYLESSRCGGFGPLQGTPGSPIDISGYNDHGLHLYNSVMYINGAITGTMGRAGVYIHSGSVITLKNGVTPTLTGTAIGDITTDDATLASTWAAIAGGTPMSVGAEMSIVKVFNNLYGA